jgi:uroporphyrinogen-III synthase
MQEAPSERPLAGRTIALTRSEEDNLGWAIELERLGARVISAPCIRLEPLSAPAIWTAIAANPSRVTDLVFTSAHAARFFIALSDQAGLSGAWRDKNVFAIGASTAAELLRLGLDAQVRDDVRTSAELAEVVVASGAIGPRSVVLLPRSRAGRSELSRRFAAAGAEIIDLPIYEPRPDPTEATTRFVEDWTRGDRPNWIVFASPSAVEAFAAVGNRVGATLIADPSVGILAIGPTTRAALDRHRTAAIAVADGASASGIAAKLVALESR